MRLLGLGGWLVAGFLFLRYRRLRARALRIIEEASDALMQSQTLISDVYRVKLSCPICDWTDDVVREDRETAIDEGNRRIAVHNDLAGHTLSGSPRTGYFRGEPLN